MNLGFCLAVIFVLMCGTIGGYELYALFFLPADQTVTFFLRSWSRIFSGLPLFVGFLLGHLFFPSPRFPPSDIPGS